jgi:hypothetical protein
LPNMSYYHRYLGSFYEDDIMSFLLRSLNLQTGGMVFTVPTVICRTLTKENMSVGFFWLMIECLNTAVPTFSAPSLLSCMQRVALT